MDYHDCERIASRIVLYEGFLADVHVAKLGILFLFSCRVRCLFWPILPFLHLVKSYRTVVLDCFAVNMSNNHFSPSLSFGKLWATEIHALIRFYECPCLIMANQVNTMIEKGKCILWLVLRNFSKSNIYQPVWKFVQNPLVTRGSSLASFSRSDE